MRRLYIVLVAICIAALLAGGCDSTGAGSDGNGDPVQDGTVTVSLSGASAIDGQHLWGWLYAADEWNLDSGEKVLAGGTQPISGGSASFVLKQSDGNWGYTDAPWSGTGGSSYDLYIITASEGGEPLETSRITADWPEKVTIDGDTSVELSYGTMVAYEPTTGTLTVILTGAEARNGKIFAAGVWAEGGGPWESEAIAADVDTIASGTATVEIEPWETMVAGTEYDVFMLILMEERAEGPEPGEDYVYQGQSDAYPVPWYVDGPRTMRPEYAGFVVIPVE